MPRRTERYPDPQFAKEHLPLMDRADNMIRDDFQLLLTSTNEKPNDILRALRIVLRKFAQGQE